MAYVPTNWATGDVITAEKLNNIENGIAETELFIVTATGNIVNTSYEVEIISCSHTCEEMHQARNSGKIIIFKLSAYDRVFSGTVTNTRYDEEDESYSCLVSIHTDIGYWDLLLADSDSATTLRFDGPTGAILSFSVNVTFGSPSIPMTAQRLFDLSKTNFILIMGADFQGRNEFINSIYKENNVYHFESKSYSFTANRDDAYPTLVTT